MIENFFKQQIETKKEGVGIGGFSIFARVREVTTYKSQAPTTYLEDGSAVQDHIINDPMTVTVEGVVGDIHLTASPIQSRLTPVNKLIGQTSSFLPQQSVAAVQRAQSVINTFQDRLRKYTSAANAGAEFLGLGSPIKPPQEAFLDAMEAAHESRQLIKIEMAYRTYDDMRITDLAVTKSAEDTALSFALTAVKIRKVAPVFTPNSVLKKSPAGGAVSVQTASKTNAGAQAGKDIATGERSLLARGLGVFG